MTCGKIVFTEAQRNFLLSGSAKALTPKEAKQVRPDEAYERFKEIRWGWQEGRPYCPHCQHEKVYEYATRGKFKCAKCSSQFSVTTRTCFSSRKMPFGLILRGIAIRLHDPKNAHQLHRDLGVQYNTAHKFMRALRPYVGNVIPKTRDNRWPFLNRDGAPATDLVTRVNGLLPQALPEQVRADVGQDIILGVLEGDLSEDDLGAQIANYIRRHYSKSEWRFSDISLSQPVPGTDRASWDDILSSEVEHF